MDVATSAPGHRGGCGHSPDAGFETEDLFAVDDRCTARWTYRYSGEDGTPHRIRGVDVFRVRDGKVAEKLSYVKG
jgi:ketosteroid isomerase-like protein